MKPGDHSDALERIARDCNRSPLEVKEFFEERTSIREHDGNMPRGAAEEWAVEDCRAYFAMRASRSPSERAARDVDATGMHPQNDGRRDSVASGKEQSP